ncbi:gamma-glutamylcyclotransferase [Mastigocladopsis repens]|uniref:gamma-glutamylcyclotransferase n=1 Tax=Mastigocladopsis repens TaxID=221287 RepID=UPI0002D8D002|nr:gamma-glutamylcyclotransferase [Mastigocladopsis repens]
MPLTRADLESKRLQRMILESGLSMQILSEAQLQASIDKTIQQQEPDSDIWLFAYGSLVWNPIFRFVERRIGTVYGLHRRFCLRAPLGRGTPDNPGLVLALERGGSCRGVVYRIAGADVASELLLVWRREMVVGSYVPRWVKVFDGTQQLEAIAFVINRHHPHYARNLSIETTAEIIATACGHIGSSAEYLLQTVDGLMTLGIKDRQLLLLRERVLAKQCCLQRVQ